MVTIERGLTAQEVSGGRAKMKYPELEGVGELIRNVQLGNNDSFAPIYEFYKDRVMGFLVRRTEDPALAEDLAQEVFIKAYKAIIGGKYNDKGRFGGFLLTIASHVFIDYTRRRQIPELGLFDSEVSPKPQPSAIAETRETLREVKTSIRNHLTSTQREVVIFSCFEDMNSREVAEEIGRKNSTAVRQSLAKARRKLEENQRILAAV